MFKDIVEELRHAHQVDKNQWDVTLYLRASDEIERLRKVGDRIAMHLDAHYGIGNQAPDWIKDDLAEWKEASCG